MELSQLDEAISKTSKDYLNADMSTVYQNAISPSVSIAINYTVEVSYKELDTGNAIETLHLVLGRLSDKILDSEVVKSKLAEKEIVLQQLESKIKGLESQVKDLERYKTFYDLYKDLQS